MQIGPELDLVLSREVLNSNLSSPSMGKSLLFSFLGIPVEDPASAEQRSRRDFFQKSEKIAHYYFQGELYSWILAKSMRHFFRVEG